jgi:hypothetical protein
VLTAALAGQEVKHAPTVAQCQADQRLWLSNLEDSPKLPAYDTLTKWEAEMMDCQTVDPDNKAKYYNTLEEASEVAGLRLMNFVTRHNLWAQFYAEDSSGKR